MTREMARSSVSRETADHAAIAKAQAAVAADPKSEAAAAELTALVRATVWPTYQDPDPVAGAAPAVRRAATLLGEGAEEEAEILLRQHLAQNRNDPPAMLLMAEIARNCGFPHNAEKILRRSVEIAPEQTENRVALAGTLYAIALSEDRFELVEELLGHLEQVLASDPDHWGALRLRASILVQIRRLEGAEDMFRRMVELRPGMPFVWMNLAHLLKTAGQFGDAVAGYRTAVALDPLSGDAWWVLADLKTFRFFQSDVDEMEAALEQELSDHARISIHFALAKAYDDLKNFERAAFHLNAGNGQRLSMQPHDPEPVRRGVDRAIGIYTPDFFVSRRGLGDPSIAPIFIVGMPRSGSTLIEQILASHPMIEGTEELFGMLQLDRELQLRQEGATCDEVLAAAPPAELHELGARYIHLSNYHRRTERPYFTDKNPSNWRYAGLIHTILPNAKIIDTRRDPMDCCFGNYRQHFQMGGNYAYGQAEMAEQYRQYLRLMRHFDEAVPGLIYHAIHDDIVDDLEGEVRRLLDYIGVPFDEACLRFFETKRAVHTPSSEQVRKPVNRSGFDRWRNYEPWIGELQDALGDLRENWRR